MAKKTTTTTRRDFLNRAWKDALHFSLELKRNCKEGIRTTDVIASLDDYPIAQTYPRELFEDEARRLGIDIDAIGETEAIRRIMAHQMERGKA